MLSNISVNCLTFILLLLCATAHLVSVTLCFEYNAYWQIVIRHNSCQLKEKM